MFLSVPALAEQANQNEMERFMKSIGMYDTFEAQRVALKKRVQTMMQRQIQAIAKQKDMQGFVELLGPEMREYARKAAQIADPEFSANSFMRLLSAKLTAKEIRELTKFYETGVGKKFIDVQREIYGPWSQAIAENQSKKLEIVMLEYVQAIKKKIRAHRNKAK